MIKTKETKVERIYNVTIHTFINPYMLELPVQAYDEKHAKRIARRICKFGIIKEITEICKTDAQYEIGTEENTEHLKDPYRDID